MGRVAEKTYLLMLAIFLSQIAYADEFVVMSNGMTCFRNKVGFVYGCAGGVRNGDTGFNDVRTGERYNYIGDTQAIGTRGGAPIGIPPDYSRDEVGLDDYSSAALEAARLNAQLPEGSRKYKEEDFVSRRGGQRILNRAALEAARLNVRQAGGLRKYKEEDFVSRRGGQRILNKAAVEAARLNVQQAKALHAEQVGGLREQQVTDMSPSQKKMRRIERKESFRRPSWGLDLPAGYFKKTVIHDEAWKYTVTQVQSHLADLGYRPGPIDGVPGDKTVGAIKRFQADNYLVVDGQPTRYLMGQLEYQNQARLFVPPEASTSN